MFLYQPQDGQEIYHNPHFQETVSRHTKSKHKYALNPGTSSSTYVPLSSHHTECVRPALVNVSVTWTDHETVLLIGIHVLYVQKEVV
jgi:hypothetical protein